MSARSACWGGAAILLSLLYETHLVFSARASFSGEWGKRRLQEQGGEGEGWDWSDVYDAMYKSNYFGIKPSCPSPHPYTLP